MRVLVHVWIYKINLSTFYGSFSSRNLNYFYNFAIKEKRFFEKKYGVRTIAPRTIAPQMIPPRIIAFRIIAPVENCPPNNCPLDDGSRKIIPKIIAPWQYPPRNCHLVPFGWFVAYIVPPRGKLSSRNIVPNKNHTRYIFSLRIRNRSNLIDSCFL